MVAAAKPSTASKVIAPGAGQAEQAELDTLHLATCTAGCRELPAEWPSDDEEAEAACIQVIWEEEEKKKKRARER